MICCWRALMCSKHWSVVARNPYKLWRIQSSQEERGFLSEGITVLLTNTWEALLVLAHTTTCAQTRLCVCAHIHTKPCSDDLLWRTRDSHLTYAWSASVTANQIAVLSPHSPSKSGLLSFSQLQPCIHHSPFSPISLRPSVPLLFFWLASSPLFFNYQVRKGLANVVQCSQYRSPNDP